MSSADTLTVGDRVHHVVHGSGVVDFIFPFKEYSGRRSRYPYLVIFDSGFKEQFLRRELIKGQYESQHNAAGASDHRV